MRYPGCAIILSYLTVPVTVITLPSILLGYNYINNIIAKSDLFIHMPVILLCVLTL